MFILPQILEISSKNLLVNQLIYMFKNNLHLLIESFTQDTSKTRYSNFFICFQEFLNSIGLTFLSISL